MKRTHDTRNTTGFRSQDSDNAQTTADNISLSGESYQDQDECESGLCSNLLAAWG